MIKYLKYSLLGLLIATQTFAGLPPTTSKGASDTTAAVTFKTNYDVPVSHSGVTSTVSLNGRLQKNYISAYVPSLNKPTANPGNGDIELNSTTGFSLFNTTLTGGIPTGAISAGASSITTFAPTSSNVIDNNYSLNVASSGAITAGQGWITDPFYIDQSDQASTLAFLVKYSVISGSANIIQSGLSTSTFAAYLYDVTNSAWIQPSGVYNMIGDGKWKGTFPTSSNGTNYRLAIICVNASGGAASLNFDSYSVGPQISVNAPAMSDFTPYTPIIVGAGAVSGVSFYSKRVGDSLEVFGTFTTGTPTGSNNTISIGYNGVNGNITIDSSKITTSSICGDAAVQDQATTVFRHGVMCANQSSGTVSIVHQTTTVNLTAGSVAGTAVFPSTAIVQVHFFAPITGWSSNTSSSADYTPNSGAFAGQQTSQVVTANVTDIAFTTITDRSGAWNGTQYKVPQAGDYVLTGSYVVSISAATTGIPYLNGSPSVCLFSTSSGTGTVSAGSCLLTALKAGDLISLRSNVGITVTFGQLSVHKLPGSPVLQASDPVNGRYFASSSAVSGSFGVVTYSGKSFDTTGSYSGGTLTIPSPGKYQFNVAIALTTTLTLNQSADLAIFVNGSQASTGTFIAGGAESNAFIYVSDILGLSQGDQITIQVRTAGSTNSILSSNFRNYFSWAKVGN